MRTGWSTATCRRCSPSTWATPSCFVYHGVRHAPRSGKMRTATPPTSPRSFERRRRRRVSKSSNDEHVGTRALRDRIGHGHLPAPEPNWSEAHGDYMPFRYRSIDAVVRHSDASFGAEAIRHTR